MCVARSEQWEAVKELLVTSSCVALKANCPLERELLNPIEAEAKGRNFGNVSLRIVCVDVSSQP